jgi:hypothetical protein
VLRVVGHWNEGFRAADPALDLVSVWHLLDATQRNVVRARLNPGEVQWRRGMAWHGMGI